MQSSRSFHFSGWQNETQLGAIAFSHHRLDPLDPGLDSGSFLTPQPQQTLSLQATLWLSQLACFDQGCW